MVHFASRQFSASKGGQSSATSVLPDVLAVRCVVFFVVRGSSGSNAVCYGSVHEAAGACVPKTCMFWWVGGSGRGCCCGNVMGLRRVLQYGQQGMYDGDLPAVMVGEEKVSVRVWRMQRGSVPGVHHREISEGIGWLGSFGVDRDDEEVKAVECLCRNIANGLLDF
jgi:hypothetical protein